MPTARRTRRRHLARSRRLTGSAALLFAVVAACGSDDEPVGAVGAAGDGSSADVVVFAAASLTEVFTAIGDAFTADHDDIDVTFSFAASSELVAQIAQGAPADVFASADEANMAKLVDAGETASAPVVFATSSLAILVSDGNPEGIATLADLADEDLVVVTCATEVPCGAYAAEVLARAGVDVTPKSYEENVRAVVAKVLLGEADAGIVYRTDVVAAGDDADGVTIPDDVNVVARYPVAVTKAADDAVAAQTFIDFVQSEDGQAILASRGFAPP
jgi:molybdate transport system substrate-binding protein